MNDLVQLMQQSPAAPLPMDPMMGASGMDPMAAAPMMGLGAEAPMGVAAPAFPSTDPAMLAQVVQQALSQLAMQDTQMLEMQQQQAAMQAQPLIDQMMMQAAAAPPPSMGMPADPAMAFGENPGALPPMMPEEFAA